MQKLTFVCLVFIVLGFLAVPEAPAEYAVKRDAVGSGATLSSGSARTLRGTVAQTPIGRSANIAYNLKAGFWYSLSLATTGVPDEPGPIPVAHRLAQNHPNPFSSSTRFAFDLPVRESAKLQVFDVTGRQIAVLVDDVLDPGPYVVDLNAAQWASGLYFYRLTTPSFSAVRKLLLLGR